MIIGDKSIHYFNYNEHPDIYYINLLNKSQLRSINDYFLYNCTNLRYINLSPLSNITTIGNDFMWHYISLTKFAPIINLEQKDDNFIDKINKGFQKLFD